MLTIKIVSSAAVQERKVMVFSRKVCPISTHCLLPTPVHRSVHRNFRRTILSSVEYVHVTSSSAFW